MRLETRNLKLLFSVLCIIGGHALALDREAFTFTNYQLQVQIDPPTHSFTAAGTITVRNDSQVPQKNVTLQISSSLSWQSITLNHKRVLYVAHPYASDIDHTGFLSEAVVTLPQPVPPRATVELEVIYGGTIELDTTRLEQIGTPKDVAAKNDWDQISTEFTAVRGVGYVAWYPVAMESVSLNEGAEYTRALGAWKARQASARMGVIFSSEQKCKFYSNGASGLLTLGVAKVPASVASENWGPMGYEPPFFVSGDYIMAGDSRARLFYLPGGEKQAHEWLAAEAATLPYLPQKNGMPVDIFELPAAGSAPYASGNNLITPLAMPDAKAAQVLLANPLSYEFLKSNRPWIAAGFAQFSQAYEREKQGGREAALAYMQQQRETLVEEEKENQKETGGAANAPSTSANSQSNAATSLAAGTDEVLYRTKAMFVWWMLRDMLGDSVLQHALAKYRAEDDREPSYMQRLLEAEAVVQHVVPKMKLEEFFDDWVYRDGGLPDFKVASTYLRRLLGAPNGNNFILTVTVENLGNAGAEVPVTAAAGTRERVTQRVAVAGHGQASLRIPMVNQPDQVIINDGSVPESDISNNTSPVAAPTASEDVQPR